MKKRWGIRQRALFLALAPASVIAFLLAFYFIETRFADLEQSLEERGVAIARQLATASEYGVFAGNRNVLQRLAESALKEADVEAVTIADSEGRVLARGGQPISPAPVMPHGRQLARTIIGEGRMLLFETPITQSQIAIEDFEIAGTSDKPGASSIIGAIQVEISRNELIARKARLLLYSLLITSAVLLATVIVATRMSRGVILPIARLTETVEKIGAGDFDARVAPDSAGVLGTLEAGVNEMAVALKSARRHLEERIAAATMALAARTEDAERANKSKSRFLAAASHDLRQPMHALGLFVAELRGKAEAAETQALVGRIDASVGAMEDLLDALLDISRLDAGGITPAPCDFPIALLLARLQNDFGVGAQKKGLKLRVSPCRAWVRSDPVPLERILQNLMSNALRYTAEGGIVVGCRRRGNSLRIEVWDSGPGIPEASRKDIFQEFLQLENPQRERGKGLGLGLAIVERLAQLLDHRVTLVSKVGFGSRFAIDVPRVSPPPVEPLEPAVEPSTRAGLTDALIVVIDDQVLVRDGMQGLLSAWGCDVIVAGSGDEAEASLQQGREPDAIICDYRLRGSENGLQAAMRLREKYGNPATPCIVISGDTALRLTEDAAAAGCRLLHKPVRPARLRAVLAGLLATG